MLGISYGEVVILTKNLGGGKEVGPYAKILTLVFCSM
jgi:hypothetical protein